MQHRKTLVGLFSALVLALALPGLASAHFQMIYTPEIVLDKGGEVDMRLVFTHPFEAGHTMDMGAPEQFFMVFQRGSEGEAQKTDLKAGLTPNDTDEYSINYIRQEGGKNAPYHVSDTASTRRTMDNTRHCAAGDMSVPSPVTAAARPVPSRLAR